jgi:hypothetical protein
VDIGAYEFGAIAGDFNRDGAVNAGDYIVWRNSLGTTVARYSGADATGNGLVDQADYELWRAGFGAVATVIGSSLHLSGVPESSTTLLLAVAAAGYLVKGRSRLHRINVRR